MKLFRLITLIPMLLLILKCLNPLKNGKPRNAIVDEWRSDRFGSDEGENGEDDIEILGCP